jgi:uncharacterized protein YkwD
MFRKGLLSFSIILAFALNVFTLFPGPDRYSSASFEEYRILDLINDTRQTQRLNPLRWDDELAAVARNYSAQMARDSFFDHWDRNGDAVEARAERAGVNHWKRIGENLFVCQGIRNIAGFAVEEWMNSPTHRQNILDRKFTATGIGMARARNGRIYITEVFIQN